MAAVGGGRRGTAGDHEDHKIQMFHVAMQDFQRYPFNLNPRHTLEKIKLVSDFRQHFDQTKNDILLVLGQNAKGVQRRLIERKIHVEFYDAGLHNSTLTLVPTLTEGRPSLTRNSSRKRRSRLRRSNVQAYAAAGAAQQQIELYHRAQPRPPDPAPISLLCTSPTFWSRDPTRWTK